VAGIGLYQKLVLMNTASVITVLVVLVLEVEVVAYDAEPEVVPLLVEVLGLELLDVEVVGELLLVDVLLELVELVVVDEVVCLVPEGHGVPL